MALTRFRLMLVMLICVVLAVTWMVADRMQGAQAATLPEVIGDDLNSINKVLIRDGLTGQAATVAEQDTIQTLLDFIKTINVEASARTEPSTGWTYYIDLYPSESNYWRLTFAGETLLVSHTTVDPYQVAQEQYYQLDGEYLTFIQDFYASL